MRQRPHNRLPRWLRRTLYITTALLVGSGLAWLFVTYALAPPGEETPAPHALAGPLREVHGIAAYLALAACGLVGHVHLRVGWRVDAMRGAGIALAASWIVLALTGLGFYYLAIDAAIPWLRWIHVGIGVALPAVLAWHIARGRRLSRPRPPDADLAR